jgi:3-dehydroquinate synthetase
VADLFCRRSPDGTGDQHSAVSEVSLSERRLVFGDAQVPYLFGVDCAGALVETVADRLADADAAMVVVDTRVKEHADALLPELARHLRVETYVLDAAERHKTLPTVQSIMEHGARQRLTRRSAIIAMGGGTAGNIAGLAAALLYRGVRLVHLPTTPVAAFDAVISLKQGVNLPAGKNLCGTYHRPVLIACDLRWLGTVPPANLRTGLAEMVKNVLVTAPQLEDRFTTAVRGLDGDWPAALRELLAIGIDAKAPYLLVDPHERGAAIVFEYGHTAGHALEFTSGGTVGHGEAVAWGMLVAAEVSRLVRGPDPTAMAAHRRLTGLLGLPVSGGAQAEPVFGGAEHPQRFPRGAQAEPVFGGAGERLRRIDRAAVRAALLADNKRGYGPCGADEVLMVLLDGIGRPASGDGRLPLVRVPVDLVLAALDTALDVGVGAAA